MFTFTYNFKTKQLTTDSQPLFENDKRSVFLCGEALGISESSEDFLAEADRFNGSFAIVVVHKDTAELIALRDRLGGKQLYWARKGDEVCISASFPEVFAFAGRRISTEALQHYFTFQYVPEPLTIGDGVFAFRQGTVNVLRDFEDGRTAETTIFSKWVPKPSDKDFASFSADIKKALTASVERHLDGTEHPAAFLSGGLDSSIIAGLAKEQRKDLKTYTISFDVPGFSESDVAARSADSYGVAHETVSVDADTFKEAVPKAMAAMGVPVADPSAVAVYILAREVSKYADLCFSGEGSDELWGGYHVYNPQGLSEKLRKLPRPIKTLAWSVISLFPEDMKGKDFFRRSFVPLKDRFAGNTFLFTEKEKRSLLKFYSKDNDFRKVTAPLFNDEDMRGASEMDMMQFVDTSLWFPGDIDVVCNKACEANGLHCVTPFTDNTVVSLSQTLTRSEKVRGTQNKIALRETFKELITDEVYSGKKKGYPVPVRVWLSGPLNEWARSIISTSEAGEYIDLKKGLSLLEKCRRHPADPMYYRKAWAILVFCIWYREIYR